MYNQSAKIEFTLPLDRYQQLVNLSKLLHIVNGEQPDVNLLAQKLLLNSIASFTAVPQQLQKLQIPVVDAPQILIEPIKESEEQRSISTAGLSGLTGNETKESNLLYLPQNWLTLTGQLSQGVRIGIVAQDTETATRCGLKLANAISRQLPVMYFAPDLLGNFSELLKGIGIKENLTTQRKALYHYIPENKTQWKDLFVTHRNNLIYKVAFIDNASTAGINYASYAAEFERLTFRTQQPITQVYLLCEDENSAEFESWYNALDIMVRAEDENLVLLKNALGANA
jgi:hypothetical protein